MSDAGLAARFLRGLHTAPDRPALRAGGKEVSYAQAHELAARWAGALQQSPKQPRAVGVLAERGPAAYLGVLAALYAGATVVPLHVSFPAARTRQMLDAAGVDAVLADDRGRAALAATERDLPVLTLKDSQGARPVEHPAPVTPDDVAYILFTSGSTGRPKGVPVTVGMTDHYFRLADARYGFAADDVFSQTFELGFDCAMFDMFCAWGAGATVQAVPESAYRDLPAFASAAGLTVWFSAPSVIALARRLGQLAPGSMNGLRWSLFAGEALRAADVASWLAAAPATTLENIYGPTELTLTITGHRWSPATSPGLCVNGLVPIGALHAGHDALLLGAGGREVAEEGELCVTGPQRTPGYLDPADDEGRFLHRHGRTWYRTGDRVRRLPGGELIYLGRLDSQVQLGGLRVELGEIEHALRGCDGVDDAVAVARPEGDGLTLAVYYTGTPAPPAALARRLRGLLPPGMLPRHYQHLDRFPLNTNRKVDRRKLAETAQASAR